MKTNKEVKINYKTALRKANYAFQESRFRMDDLAIMVLPYIDWADVSCKYIPGDGMCFLWDSGILHNSVVCPVDIFIDYINNHGSITEEEALKLCI